MIGAQQKFSGKKRKDVAGRYFLARPFIEDTVGLDSTGMRRDV
jgi:hypothetical protein